MVKLTKAEHELAYMYSKGWDAEKIAEVKGQGLKRIQTRTEKLLAKLEVGTTDQMVKKVFPE